MNFRAFNNLDFNAGVALLNVASWLPTLVQPARPIVYAAGDSLVERPKPIAFVTLMVPDPMRGSLEKTTTVNPLRGTSSQLGPDPKNRKSIKILGPIFIFTPAPKPIVTAASSVWNCGVFDLSVFNG